MTGKELRVKLVSAGKQVTDLAQLMGISHQSLSQALNAKDVKTGLVEKIASALNLPLSFFYEDSAGAHITTNGDHAIANGDHAIAAIDSTVSGSSEKAVLEERILGMQRLLAEKERIIQMYEQLYPPTSSDRHRTTDI